MTEKISRFLAENKLVDAIDEKRIISDFLHEISAGLAGRPSSLPMIPAYLAADPIVTPDKPVVVIDAGGTNLRIAVVSFDSQGVPRITGLKRHPMPGTQGYVTANDFFETLAEHLMDVIENSSRIGFCFSYSASITPECDGRLTHWSKQIQAPEVEGLMIGRELSQRLEKRGYKRRITILNDTVATLLAGKSAGMTHSYSDYISYILGTGTNTAMVSPNAAITKLPNLPAEGEMIVNLESGHFALVPQGNLDKQFDSTLLDPGHYLLEKMSAGGYLGGLALVALKAAATEGLLSSPGKDGIETLSELDNKTFDDFCSGTAQPDNALSQLKLDSQGRGIIAAIGHAIYTRSAHLAAINLASVLINGKLGRGSDAPICVNVDGSTFYKTRTIDFKATVEGHLDRILEPRGIRYELIQVDDSPIVGAAIAALTR